MLSLLIRKFSDRGPQHFTKGESSEAWGTAWRKPALHYHDGGKKGNPAIFAGNFTIGYKEPRP